MAKRLILFITGALGLMFLAVVIFGISVMGDRFCKIELRNLREESISIKTVISTGNEWTMVVDSVSLAPNEKFELGDCINCTTLKQSDFKFDAIVIIVPGKKPKLIHRKGLADYLNTLDRVNCSTFELL